MAIDLKPAVGRLLLRKSVLFHGHFMVGGRITRITRDRVYFVHALGQGDIYVARHSVTAVCDTLDEVDALLAFDESARKQHHQLSCCLREQLKREFGL